MKKRPRVAHLKKTVPTPLAASKPIIVAKSPSTKEQ